MFRMNTQTPHIFGVRNVDGSSIVTVLMAAGLISISVVGLGTIMSNLGKTSQKSRLISTTLALESALVNAIQDEDNYASVRDTMAAVSAPMSVTGLELKSNGEKIAVVGTPLYYDLNGKICSHSNCPIKLEADIRCTPASPYASCSAAYRISTKPATGEGTAAPVASVGAKGSGAFTNADYVIPILYNFYVQKSAAACDPSATLAVTGFSRDTGIPYCIEKPQSACPAGTIAKAITFTNTTDLNGRLAFACSPLKKLTCPTGYSIQNFSPTSLDSSPSGTCVFIGKDNVAWRTNPPAAPSVSGTFCPTAHGFYKTQATCTLVNVVATPGRQSFNCNPHDCNCTPCPATAPPGCTPSCSTCYDTCYNDVSPVAGSISKSDGADATASCTVNIPAQPGNAPAAVWRADVQMTGKCVRTVPETVSATGVE